MIRVAGIDLSIASTGIARLDWPDAGEPTHRTFLIKSEATPGATLADQSTRMIDVRARVAQAVTGVDLVVIEGPATGLAANAGGFGLWGLWWQVVTDLHTHGVPVASMSPSTLKVYAVGFGGSARQKVTKADIKRAVQQRYPQFLTAGSHDVADAIILTAAGARHLGRPIDDLPATHQRAMNSVRWPTIPGGN